MDFVTLNCNLSVRLVLAADTPNTSIDTIDMALSALPLLTAGDVAASSSVMLSLDSHYTFYTDSSLINLGSKDVSMDSGFLNFIATYKWGIIHDWPSSSHAEAAAIYAALSASPANSVVYIYTDSQFSIEGLKYCFLFDYLDSLLPLKVKAHSNFYWNDFAVSLANTAHTSEDAVLIFRFDLATVHDYILIYNDVVCESNPRHLFKQYHQMLYMKDLLELSRFQAGDNASCDYSSQIDRITSLPCWTFLSSNWSSYSLICGCLRTIFLEAFETLGISRLTAMNVVAAIHNNFVNKFHKRIWNLRSYDKGLWKHVINITSKLKQSSRPKGLSKSSYLPYSSLPPLIHVDSHDSRTDWLKNLIRYGLFWFDHISGFMGRLTVLLNNCFCRIECRF
ncbi:hypothetical protein RhiirC2_797004 [Rhizophagus irregularis]|uniref:RNase H type-1 domain-containing protein n=1 Tax=Rhizophagus irregularis TaxID=588596 RepID=A0A2N1M8Q5_9GLOM|nr:hypothetical protein RhiirC2_797004 [Rhizophagus irregularis]